MRQEELRIREVLVQQRGRQDLVKSLAAGYSGAGAHLCNVGLYEEAVQSCDRAIQLVEKVRGVIDENWAATISGEALLNKGLALGRLGKTRERLQAYQRAIDILDPAMEREPMFAGQLTLGYCLRNCAAALEGVHEYDQAAEVAHRGIQLFEALQAANPDNQQLHHHEAECRMNLALALADLGRFDDAKKQYREGRVIWERLVNNLGLAELSEHLAQCLLNEGKCRNEFGDTAGAMAVNDRAVAMFDQLVRAGGRSDLTSWLVMSMLNRGLFVSHSDKAAAVGYYKEAISFCEHQIRESPNCGIEPDLALLFNNLACSYIDMGETDEAIQSIDRAREGYRHLVDSLGRSEFRGDIYECHYVKGLAYEGSGDEQAALREFEQGIAGLEQVLQNVENWDSARKLALCCLKKSALSEDTNMAIAAADRAIGILEHRVCEQGDRQWAADLALCYNNKGWRLGTLAQWNDALVCIDRGLQIDENTELLWVNRSWVLLNLGRRREAIACCDEGLRRFPQNETLLENRQAAQ